MESGRDRTALSLLVVVQGLDGVPSLKTSMPQAVSFYDSSIPPR